MLMLREFGGGWVFYGFLVFLALLFIWKVADRIIMWFKGEHY